MAVEHPHAGGAVFVATRDGDLDVFASAARARSHLEAIDVEDGEYAAAFRVDGAVLALLVRGDAVDPVLTGDVDEAALRALIDACTDRVPSAPRAATPLDLAELWLAAQWQRRWPRRPQWLDRRLHGSGPPTRDELAAPSGGLGPGLVRPQRLRELVSEVLDELPAGSVDAVEGTSPGGATLHLRPRARGAIDVLLVHRVAQVDAVVGGGAPIEITAPHDVNYGPPERAWDDDLRIVLAAVARGEVVLGVDAAGRTMTVDVPGERLGAIVHPHGPLQTRRPAPWG